MGFLPVEQLGFAFLTNLGRGGSLFNLSVKVGLLSRLFGLNQGLPDFLAGLLPVLEAGSATVAAQTVPADRRTIEPYLGLYEDGFLLCFDEANGLQLRHDIRSMPLLALSDGSYVVADGPEVILEQRVTFAADKSGVPVMTIAGCAPVRWLTRG